MDKNTIQYICQNSQIRIPEYAKTGIDMANLFGISQNDDKINYKEFFSTDDKVLCFDDLERANVDVIDILGYINNFVEHDHIKTIIICNEKELSTKLKSNNLEMKTFIATYMLDKQGELLKSDKPVVEKIKDKIEHVFDKANEYERIKEKLIGETFEYAPKFDYIINGLLMRYESDTDLIRFLRANTNIIISTFNKSGTRNLRILKHALNDFQKIYEMISKNYPNISNAIMQTMLIFTIAISFEIKAGKITKDKFTDIKNNEEYKAMLVSSRVLMDNKQFYIKEFDNTYYYNFKAEYRFFKFIEYNVRTRIFDMKIFKENMEVVLNTAGFGKIPAYKRLLTEEYWKISDNRQFYIKEFDNNYYYNFKSEYRFFKFIEYYIRTRIFDMKIFKENMETIINTIDTENLPFDMKIFKENMETIINTIDTENLPGYKRLLTEEYWKISDDEFDKVINSIIEDVKQGNLRLIDNVKIFAYFSYFVRKKLIDYDLKTIKSVFFNGMNIASLKSEYCPNVEEELSKIAINEDAEDMEDILNHFNMLNGQLHDKMYKEKAEEVFKCIPMKMEQFYEKFDKECMDVPIFKYYDPLIDYDLKTIKSVFFNGMNIASLKSEYCPNVEEELSKIAIDEDAEDMEDILNHFNMLNGQLHDKMYKEKAEEVFKCIPMRMEQFYEKFDRECMNVPIFKYYDSYQMFQRISCASNEDIVLIKEKLANRADKYTKEIEPEMKNIKQLKQVIDDYLKGKDPSIKNVMLKEFSANLGYILDKYKLSFLPKKEEKSEEEITG